MKTGKTSLIACLFAISCSASAAQSAVCTIKSSVSPEFLNGLHTKYLQYMAAQLNCELDIFPMPFARRVLSLKSGDIDLMVGLKQLHEEVGFQFLRPSYESLQSKYYVRKEDAEQFSDEDAFRYATAGVSIDEKGLPVGTRGYFKDIVPVTLLEQKIGLLIKGRIDTFIHFESSAMYMIREMGYENEIVSAPLQIGESLDYFFAVHDNSPLFARKAELEAIIKDAVLSGQFAKIRAEHEASLVN